MFSFFDSETWDTLYYTPMHPPSSSFIHSISCMPSHACLCILQCNSISSSAMRDIEVLDVSTMFYMLFMY